MRKKLVAAAVVAATLVLGASSALAGEVTGALHDDKEQTPDYTPISPLSDHQVDASACAFSGLEDGESMSGPVEDHGPGFTQTPHYEAGHVYPPGVAAFNPFYNCVGLDPTDGTPPGRGPQH